VIPVPDTSRRARSSWPRPERDAIGKGFIRNRYIGRIFHNAGQAIRKNRFARSSASWGCRNCQGRDHLIDRRLDRANDGSIVRSTSGQYFCLDRAPPVRFWRTEFLRIACGHLKCGRYSGCG